MSKIINCKTCSQEIASSAKSCPNCGARNKINWIMIISPILLVLLGIVIYMMNTPAMSESEMNELNNKFKQEGIDYQVKPKSSKKDYEIEINRNDSGINFDYATIRLKKGFELKEEHIIQVYNDFVIEQNFENVDLVFNDGENIKAVRMLGDDYKPEPSRNTFIYGDYLENGSLSNTTKGKITNDNKIIYPYDL